jgi:hypothetical protein
MTHYSPGSRPAATIENTLTTFGLSSRIPVTRAFGWKLLPTWLPRIITAVAAGSRITDLLDPENGIITARLMA